MRDRMRDMLGATMPAAEPPSTLSVDEVVRSGRRRLRRRRLGVAGSSGAGVAAVAVAGLLLPAALGGGPDTTPPAPGGLSAPATDEPTAPPSDPGTREPTAEPSDCEFDVFPDVSFDWPDASQQVRDVFASHAPQVTLSRICGHPAPLELAVDEDAEGPVERAHKYASADVASNGQSGSLQVDYYFPGGWVEEPDDPEAYGPDPTPRHLWGPDFCEAPDEWETRSCSEEQTLPDGSRLRTFTAEYDYSDDPEQDQRQPGASVGALLFRDEIAILVRAGAETVDELVFDPDTLGAITADLPDVPAGD